MSAKKKRDQPLLTDDQRVKAFIKLLESGGHSRSMREKFSDFLELAFSAVAKRCAQDEARADELEDRYMKTVNRYREEEQNMIRDVYPEMLGIMIMSMMEADGDFLGRVAAELNTLNAEQGQFFTPYEVSKMMALMSFTGFEEMIQRDGYITLLEPAAGSGGMVLAYADIMQQAGYDITTTMLVQTVDVNYAAYQMCFLQLAYRGVPALVVRGNSLSMEVFESTWTPAAIHRFYPRHGHLSFEKPVMAERTIETVLEELIAASHEEVKEEVVIPVSDGKYQQMSLF